MFSLYCCSIQVMNAAMHGPFHLRHFVSNHFSSLSLLNITMHGMLWRPVSSGERDEIGLVEVLHLSSNVDKKRKKERNVLPIKNEKHSYIWNEYIPTKELEKKSS